MQFVDAPDSPDLFLRKVDDSGRVEFGLYRVFYGYRVRAGFVGEGSVWWDWCGGADDTQIRCLYATAQAILVQREANEDAFRGVPSVSQVKPYIHDTVFVDAIIAAAGNIALHLPKWTPAKFRERASNHAQSLYPDWVTDGV